MSKTMSTITFEELKAKYANKLTKDVEVSCRILAKLKDGYIVDINEDWEGFIPSTHLTSEEVNQNEELKAVVLSGPDKSDRYLVSPRALKEKEIWGKLEQLRLEENSFKVTIAKVIKGGAEVFIDSIRAFLPGRYIRLPGIAQENWIGQEIEVLIEEINQKERKLILNQKKAVDLEKQRKAEDTLLKLKEGDVITAPVLRIADFGVFIDLGGIDGLIPASELSWGRYNHPKEVVKVGQEVKAVIFRVEKESQRVALSIKKLLGDPWTQIKSKVEAGMLIYGTVISEAAFGIFVELLPGIEALLHNSEIPEGSEKPKVGSTIIAKVVKLDINQKKIGLSLIDVAQEKIEGVKLQSDESENTPSSNGNGNGNGNNGVDYDSINIPSISLDNFALCSLENETEEALNN